MTIVKRALVSLAWAGLLVAGLEVFSSDAEAFLCRPTTIPWGFEPTGVSCSQTCDSERYVSRSSPASVCVIYGYKF